MKIQKGDTIIVRSGKDRGKQAEVTRVFRSQNMLIVKGINVVKRHFKKQGRTPGRVVEMEKPIHASNVSLICPHTGKPTRIGYKRVIITENGKTYSQKDFYSLPNGENLVIKLRKKLRISKKSGKVI